MTRDGLFTALADVVGRSKSPPFNFAVVDEAQDLGVAHLKFLAALGAGRADALFFAGDTGQRIFQPPFSWKTLGLDVRGRSRTLRVNYRTSHQIREQADRLLAEKVADADGNEQERDDTVSVFDGPPPVVKVAQGEAAEIAAVAEWLRGIFAAGVRPDECALFVRPASELGRAEKVVAAAGLACAVLDKQPAGAMDRVSVGTMHLAKGLEFRAVAVMACDDEVIPSQARIEAVGDAGDLLDVYESERHLL